MGRNTVGGWGGDTVVGLKKIKMCRDGETILNIYFVKELSFCHSLKFSNLYISATSGFDISDLNYLI